MNLYNKNESVCFDVMDSYTDETLGELILSRNTGDCFLLGNVKEVGEASMAIIASPIIKCIDFTHAFEMFKSDSMAIFKIYLCETRRLKDFEPDPDKNHVAISEPCLWREFFICGENYSEIGRAFRNAAVYSFAQKDWKSFFSEAQPAKHDFCKFKNLILVTENVREYKKFRKSASRYPKYFTQLEY